MKLIQVNLASPSQLDWLIAVKRNSRVCVLNGSPHDKDLIDMQCDGNTELNYTSNAGLMYPVIREYKVSVLHDGEWEFDPSDPEDNGSRWMARTLLTPDTKVAQYEESPLMAAARVLCLQFYGYSARIPEILA